MDSNGSRTLQQLEQQIREDLLTHLKAIGVDSANNGSHSLSKSAIRAMHAAQRAENIAKERVSLLPKLPKLLRYFARGAEVIPELVRPSLIPVNASDETSYLFRLATTLWSVPVSKGFGRRMRFLVMDASNGKLIGVLALGDPVFNLRARDQWIGWTPDERRERLVHVMDAYVVGAVPPYNRLLGGKLVTSLIGSREISQYFCWKYSNSRGIISKKEKHAYLALVTVTSALGRSSMYNRIELPGLVKLEMIGETSGWGHFHISSELFEKMRQLLAERGHPYASGHRYGQGPNWRMRVVKQALTYLGMNPNLLRHGIHREIYAMPLAENWRAFLRGTESDCILNRPTLDEISDNCKQRWIIPRAARCPDYKEWTSQDTRAMFQFLFAPFCQSTNTMTPLFDTTLSFL